MMLLPLSLIPDVSVKQKRRVVDDAVVDAVVEAENARVEAVVEAEDARVEAVVDAEDARVDEVVVEGEGEEAVDEAVVVPLSREGMENTMTLRQLKDMCTQRNLSAAGRKSELAKRVMEYDRSNP